VVPQTVELHDRARAPAQRHRLSFHDACIAAAAATAGRRTLYSEDMNHRQMLADGLTVLNPFVRR